MEIDLNEAQAKLYEIGELAWAGEEIVITRKGKPYMLLVPLSKSGQADNPASQKVEKSGKIGDSQPSSIRHNS